MQTVMLLIHLFIATALVMVVLLQKSEGGALGIGGGGGGGFLTGRGQANLLTRITAGLALAFFLSSIGLSLVANHRTAPAGSVFDKTSTPAAPVAPAGTTTDAATPPAATAPAAGAAPAIDAPAKTEPAQPRGGILDKLE